MEETAFKVSIMGIKKSLLEKLVSIAVWALTVMGGGHPGYSR
jgi:hypothetical protein